MNTGRAQTAKLPPPYGTLVFDCDSTLASIEGIEALAAAGHEKAAEIRELTERAMNGELPLEDVYGARLALLAPTRAAVERIGALYVGHLLPNVRALIQALLALEKRVCIVSGGLLQPVQVLANAIGLGDSDVDAVAILHDAAGNYAGFDEDSPLARAGGKLEVLRELAEGEDARPPVALVGDGATDLEAAPVCARFVAFGGVERRAAIFRAADASCSAADFAALLPLLASPAEIERLRASPEHSPLVRAAERFLSEAPDSPD